MKELEEIYKFLDEDEKKKIKKVANIVKKLLKNETTGHDYWHSIRVLNLSLIIAREEIKRKKNLKLDIFALAIAALIHDLLDWKFKRKINIKEILKSAGIEKSTIKNVLRIMSGISFKGALVKDKVRSLESKILQDADRLDALGAIGIARCFATGAFLGKQIFNPEIKPKLHKNFLSYKKSKSTSINHFYEKLFLLRKRMNTKFAKDIAKEREKFMKYFLKRFYIEFEAKDAKNLKIKNL